MNKHSINTNSILKVNMYNLVAISKHLFGDGSVRTIHSDFSYYIDSS